jgi:hypothetical protein
VTTSPIPLLDVTGFDRTAALSQSERDALTTLGWQLRRRRSHDAELPEWDVIGRLLAPLDAARSELRDRPDTPLHRRSALRTRSGWYCAGARKRELNRTEFPGGSNS